jgi:hypothetical protein
MERHAIQAKLIADLIEGLEVFNVRDKLNVPSDVELMMTIGAILAVLRNRMGVPRVKGAIEAAVKAMEKLQ